MSSKRKRTDAEMASGSAFSSIQPNNWMDPQYVNLQTLSNGLKRATFCIHFKDSTWKAVKKSSMPTDSDTHNFFECDLTLPECTGLNALVGGDSSRTCYAAPTGKTKLNFPNIHDVTFRNTYWPAGYSTMQQPGGQSNPKYTTNVHSELHMLCLFTDGRDELQDMVPTFTDKGTGAQSIDALWDLTRMSMGDGLIEGLAVQHNFGNELEKKDESSDEMLKTITWAEVRDGARDDKEFNFSNITKGGYQVLNDVVKLFVYDTAVPKNITLPTANDAVISMSAAYRPWTLSVQIDYEVKQVELDKLLVYRQSLQNYISAKVKPEQKIIGFLDVDGDDEGFPVVESRFECADKAKWTKQPKSKKKF